MFNIVGRDSDGAAIAGGTQNHVDTNTSNSVIGGGWANAIGANSLANTIAGGRWNDIGTDDKHIATVDADGVALSAIQGLNQKVEAARQVSNARAEQLEAENAELRRELADLRHLVTSLLPRSEPPSFP